MSNRGLLFIPDISGFTKLTVDIFIKKTLLGPLLFSLTKKTKIKAAFERSLQRLEQLIKEIPNFDYDPDQN